MKKKEKNKLSGPAIIGIFIVAIVVFIIQNPLILVVIAVIGLVYLLFFSKRDDENNRQDPISPPDDENDWLPHPGVPGWSFYNIVGMQYHNLQEKDFGIHLEAKAKVEPNNPYDSNAVGIYNGNKLVGYIPKRDNELLSLYIQGQKGKSTPATYRIWRRDEKIYGIAYIYDENINDI